MYTSHFLALGLFIAAPLGVVSGGVNSLADVTIFKASAGAFGETTGVRYPVLFPEHN